jgi:3-oxoacyl-[acyl-carrier-protein] synthase II
VTRQGTVLGEGAAFLILETLEHALTRNATVYAEVLGYGSSLDAFAVSDPDPSGRGAIDCMRRAMKSARLVPQDIDCISAHGTGTPKNDVIETLAIKEVLGPHAYEIPVHSVKSMTGHMIAASGAAEAAAAALTLAHSKVPPTINLTQPDSQCDLDYVPGAARLFTGRTVLSNSFGFGGQNATIILGKYAG